MTKEKPVTKFCKHCKSEIPYGAKVCPQCRKKQGGKGKWIIICLVIFFIFWGIGMGESNDAEKNSSNTEKQETKSEKKSEVTKNETQDTTKEKEETKSKYYLGETWSDKNISVTFADSGEYTEYNKYNAPKEGNKIIFAEFEVENIGKSDATVQYVNFHAYADGYEVDQSYAPEGTGMDFSLSLSAGRKGKGMVAFEVPENAEEIEIEFEPNIFSSKKVIFVYK